MMGGSSVDDDWEFASSSNEAWTLVLVGRTGNGKSATGNSILREKAFTSKSSPSSVTSSCEMQQTVLNDGQIINVIDTPGLFDVSAESEFVGKEIVKCIDFAKDGIHAILVVLSIRTRFTDEEASALHRLQTLFGSKIVDYMIVVFTGGDELEENDVTLKDYLGDACPKPLKEIISLCENRYVLFDNKTKDEKKRSGQVQQLLAFVNTVVSQNGGKPFTDEIITQLKKEQKKADSLEMQPIYDHQLQRIIDMVELKSKLDIENQSNALTVELGDKLKDTLEAKFKDYTQKTEEKLSSLTKELKDQKVLIMAH